MTQTLHSHAPLLVNTLGHMAGVLIFGSFLFLFAKSRRAVRQRGFLLSACAAALALLWNVGSLIVLALSERGAPQSELIVALSFSVLSLLPAVLLHLALDQRYRALWLAGYLLSAVAVALHFAELAVPLPQYHTLGLTLITAGYGVLTLVAVFLLSRSRHHGEGRLRSRIFGSMSLFLFAMSFVHFGPEHGEAAWARELAFHHAGIPLALFVLLQDYRFLLLDVFVRFLANALLAALLAFAVIGLELRYSLWASAQNSPFMQGLLITAFGLLLFLFAFTRNSFQQWLTRVVFLRSDLDATLHAIRTQAARSVEESSFLSQAAREVAGFLSVTETRLLDSIPNAASTEPHSLLPAPLGDRSPLRSDPAVAWAEVVVPLRFSRGDAHHLLLGPRRGGRRYLSEDLQNLATIASAVVEQVERLRKNELQRLVNQAELRALRAQINPHFLFNSLNTLYGIIPRDLKSARQTVLNLAEIFRYFLQTDAQFSSLSDELRIVKAYLDIESLRLGDRLVTALEIDSAALSSKIPILSIQPLVENAVKHGISPRPEGGSVALIVALQDEELRVEVQDTGVGFPPSSEQAQKGVGLENLRRRLKLYYGEQAELSVQSSHTGSIVGFRIRQPQPAEVHGG